MSAIYECECDSFEMYEEQDSFEMAEAVPGLGVPSGGLTGQVLKKRSDEDFDTEWADESGGGGGTSDYTQLSNKPQINGNTLAGNKTGTDLGLVNAVPGKQLSTEDYTAEEKTKLSGIEAQANKTVIDSTLTNAGQAADAKKTGDAVSELRNTLSHKADVIYDTASGDIASFPDGADGLPVKDLTVAIEPVQSGTGDPSPTNVRPISGWTGANVSRTGANMFSYGAINSTDHGITLSASKNGEVSISGTNTAGSTFSRRFNSVSFLFKAGHTYYVKGFWSGNYVPSSSGLLLKFATGWYGEGEIFNELNSPYTPAEDVEAYLFIRVNNGYSVPTGLTFAPYVSTTPPPSDRSYYFGTTIPISWQSSAGTVYGGTLDVTSGVLTVVNGYKDFGDMAWTRDGSGVFWSNSIDTSKVGRCNLLCSNYEYVKTNFVISAYASWKDKTIMRNDSAAFLYCKNTDYSDATTFKTAMSGVQLVYELATPQTYQLTPTEVTTLLGQNNIWADTGDSTVEYPCDSKLYIDKKLAALVAALS